MQEILFLYPHMAEKERENLSVLPYIRAPQYIMRNAGLEEAQAGIKIAGRNINNLRDATPPLWQNVKRN